MVARFWHCHEVVFQKVYRVGNTFFFFFLHLSVTRRDDWGHVTSLLQGKMAGYVWMVEETKYFEQVIKGKKCQPSKHTQMIEILQEMRLKNAFSAFQWKQLQIAILRCFNFINIYIMKNCHGNKDSDCRRRRVLKMDGEFGSDAALYSTIVTTAAVTIVLLRVILILS